MKNKKKLLSTIKNLLASHTFLGVQINLHSGVSTGVKDFTSVDL